MKCQIITPLLMHGANPKEIELRPPSFKGIMRFWWRAIHGNLSLNELKENERDIFGGAGNGNAKRSSFSIKIISFPTKKQQVNPLPHKEKSFKIEGFEVGETFEIEFLGKNKKLAEQIFELSTILGGFGQRARRGFGSIQIIKDNQEEITEDYVKDLIKNINSNFCFDDRMFENKGEYPYIKSIKIGKRYDNYYDILKQIGKATHDYPYFGSANPRFASPLWISVIKNGDIYKPIITELNSPIYCCVNLLNLNKYKKFKNKDFLKNMTDKQKREFCIEELKNFEKAIL